MRAHSTRAFASLAAVVLLLSASPSMAAWPSMPAWEGSRGEDILAKGIDALIVRPLASARVVIGAALLLPAALLSSPSGREGFDAAYDTLVQEPMEYAFQRELGDF